MLVKYEFLKILRKKSTLIVMAASLLITAFLFGLPAMQYQTYDQNGVIKGAEGIAYNKGLYEDISVPLTEEYVTGLIQDVQTLFENPDNVGYDGNEKFIIGDAYWNEIAPKEKLLNMIARNYVGPNESAGYNIFPDIDISDGANFYETMQAKFNADINSSVRSMTDEQKDYWSSMASEVDQQPFLYHGLQQS